MLTDWAVECLVWFHPVRTHHEHTETRTTDTPTQNTDTTPKLSENCSRLRSPRPATALRCGEATTRPITNGS